MDGILYYTSLHDAKYPNFKTSKMVWCCLSMDRIANDCSDIKQVFEWMFQMIYVQQWYEILPENIIEIGFFQRMVYNISYIMPAVQGGGCCSGGLGLTSF